MNISPVVQSVLDELKAQGFEPKKSGREWKCKCPVHLGDKADLRIGVGPDGLVSFHCRHQCSAPSVIEAIGLDRELLSDKFQQELSQAVEVIGNPVLLCAADVQAQEVSWLWAGRLPLGRLSLLVGRPGEGKSFATLDWAARVSTGRDWPDGSSCEVGSVLLVSAEDDPGDTIRPRLDAHDADPSQIHMLKGIYAHDKNGKLIEGAFTLANIEALRQAIATIGNVRLIVIDPIGSYMGGKVDAHRDNEVRGVLAPLAALAQESNAAVVLVAHQRKGKAVNPDDMTLGSTGFVGLARSVLHLMRDPDDEDRRLLLPGKMNLAVPAPGLAFTIEGEPARVQWASDTVSITAAEVLAKSSGGSSAGDKARDWLRDVLSDGPLASNEIKKMAEQDGLAWRTIERAKKQIGVRAMREGFGKGGRSLWAMPSIGRQDESKTAKSAIEGDVADYGGVCDSEQSDGVPPADLHGPNLNNETRICDTNPVDSDQEGEK